MTYRIRQLVRATFLCVGFLVSVNACLPPENRIVDVRQMSVEKRAELGEKIIFGAVGASGTQGAVGKGQCPLCHGFQEGQLSERAPNLWGTPYRQRTSPTPLDYLAESHACPSCYVTGGFDVRGTEGRESPMPMMHKPPINLSIDELIAVDTWLFYREGVVPPSPEEIEQAYRKVIPESEWPKPSKDVKIYPAMYTADIRHDGSWTLSGKEPMDVMFTTALCFACHDIPGIPGAVGAVGPKLVMKTLAPKRLEDPTYKGKATTVRDYVIESILDPSVYVVAGYPDHIMPKDYGTRLSKRALDKMASYLSRLEQAVDPPGAENRNK